MRTQEDILKERNDMLNAGFPYCYGESGVQMHCDTCIREYERRKKFLPHLITNQKEK